MRKPLIAGNWKMNNGIKEAKSFCEELKNLDISENVEASVCVPFLDIQTVVDELKDTDISVGAQNMYFEESGAFTGEVSPTMLKDAGVKYVILGHSERREHFKEDDSLINKKVLSAFEHGLNPILCVGETLEEREAGKEKDKVKGQIEENLKDLDEKYIEDLVIAYEPIWAIGTGKTASSDDAEEMCAYIRELVKENFSNDAADKVRIQYGGSVKPENVSEIMSKANIDGALVGGASLNTESFNALVNYEVKND